MADQMRMTDRDAALPSPAGLVCYIHGDYTASAPRPGMGSCLSSGGYRAMLFDLGRVFRFNEAGILEKLNRISSVSGGSIMTGVLGFKWKRLVFSGGIVTNIQTEVIDLARKMAEETIDVFCCGQSNLFAWDNQ